MLEKLGYSNNNSTGELQSIELQINNPTIINPKSSFQITLYNSDTKIIQNVAKILKDENSWNKSKELLPIFSLYDVRCKEVDEYILKYKPHYQELFKKQIATSVDYQSATEKDKEIIEDEIKDNIINLIPERADCDLKILFDYNEIDFSIKNENRLFVSEFLTLNL